MFTILIVDDSDAVHFAVKQTLKKHLTINYSIQQAFDGCQALQCISSQPVDLVITDISMPNMDGYELIAHLRQDSQVPIIAMTCGQFANQDTIDIINFAQGLGADFTLDKQSELNGLAEMVMAVLYKHNQIRELGLSKPAQYPS